MRHYSLLLALSLMSPLAAYESAFPKTEVGVIEIKQLPASKVILTRSTEAYYKDSNNLFRPLFEYIQENEIAMTIPVEAEIEPGAMYFYLGTQAANRELQASEAVEIQTLPERTVASIGTRGRYSEANFIKAKAKLEAWLAEQAGYQAIGPARVVYWNGPFTLPAMKRAEIHIPVRRSP